ncbi:DNA-directed RNA polymerase subunit epsilon [Haloplanus sp. GCM10025708]|uniref:DNA-directed RNA polymerase subunit epsilon n=1 Tax=Haloferacaceae TaxID=1644056 RepID=UPI00361E8A9C
MTDRGIPTRSRPSANSAEQHARLDVRPGSGALARSAANRDVHTRRWGVVSPAATLIGRAESPSADVSETVRQLHDERHAAMAGHGERMHRLDKLRITHALCSHLSLTPWQRDRALGIVRDLDFSAFGSQRAIEKVALVAIRYVVDDDRKRRLGLHDTEWVNDRSPEELQSLYDRFDSVKDEAAFEDLLDAHDLDKTSLNRLHRTLREEVESRGVGGVALGRNPYRDPNLPDVRDRERTTESDE